MTHTVSLARFVKQNRFDLIHTNSLKGGHHWGFRSSACGCPGYLARERSHRRPTTFRRLWSAYSDFLARVVPAFIIANSEATLATVKLEGRSPSRAIGSGVNIASYPTPVFSIAQPTDHRHRGSPCCLEGPASLPSRCGEGLAALSGDALHHYRRSIVRRVWLRTRASHADAYASQSRTRLSSRGLSTMCLVVSRKLSVLVHASITGEPYGQVIIEGMAAGKPVIATNGGGVPEIVVDGVTGYLVPMNDVNAMADAMIQLISDPDRCVDDGKARQRTSTESASR